MKILDISIVDQLGRTVDFTESHDGSLLVVQLTDAKAGVYFVTMCTETGVVQERLVLTSTGE